MNDLLKRIADLSPEKRGLLAQKLKSTKKVAPAAKRIPRHNGPGDLPLSYAQQRLWFLDQLRPGNATYNIPAAVRLRGSLNLKAMEDALSEVVRRHEILRTTFPAVDGQPRQVIHPAQPIRLPVKSLMSFPEDSREQEVRRLARLNSSEPFDLAHGPLLRASLTQIGDEDYVLIFTIHHIISDGWSLGVLVREVGVLYEAFSKGEPSPLPEMVIQYKDYAVWQQQPFHQELFAQQLEYWKRQLAGLHPTIDLSTRPRPPIQSFRGSIAEFELPEKLSRSILELGQREGATLFMTLLTGFSVLLHRYTGRNDLVVGTDVANRNWSDTEGLIGFFINQLIVRTNTSGDPTFRELLRRVKDVALDGFANQELPFERLVAALQPERSLSYTPLFQVKLVVQNTPVEPISLHSLTLEPFTVHNGTVGFDLILTVAESTNKLQGSLEYNTDIFDTAAIQRLLGHYETILDSAVKDPEQRISRLPMLTDAERRQLLGDFNRCVKDFSASLPCLHELFEQQVASRPDHPALIAGSVQLTYSELNDRANQLAHFLRSLGVGAEVRVGLCVERSVELVVGILGVLKAGAAYVPLDPHYPSERLSFMLEDSAVPVLLTQQHLLDNLPSVWSQIVDLDTDRESIAQESTTNPNVEVTPRNAAYVIYTSGSTGKPKGVVVEHHGIANLVRWQATNFNLTRESRISQFASYSFDAAVGETCMALLNGATLVMLERDELDSQALIEMVNRHRINVMVMVPSMIKVLDVDALEYPEELTVVAVGEACQPELAQRWSRRCRFMNAYGPTEYTVYSHLWRVEPELAAQTASVPIGFPISNTRTYILDEHLNPVPVGVTGEIYISGPGIARGYLNNPATTAAKFLPNPFLIYEYFTDHGRLDAPTANAEFREFKRNGYRRHLVEPATRPEWTMPISPSMIFKLIESVSPDLIKKTHSFITRHGQDSVVYGAFSRYLLEGIKSSYASCGINPEILRRLLPFECFDGIQGVDFGFGNGEILKTLKGMGARIKGLDFNPVFVQKARDNGLDAEMVKVDLAPAEFAEISGMEPGSQDFVVSTLLMDRLSNPRNFLANLFLVLKERGRFAIQTLLPIVGVDDGEIEDPLTYTPEGSLIVPGKTIEEDKEVLICQLRKLGADKIGVFELPYVVMSRDGLQEYTVWSFTGIKDSFATQKNGVEYYDTMYKTGDRGRFLEDGAIDFRGRVDAQVKIRGFRIEIGDIEATLSAHPDVNDCAVVARENSLGGQRLVAYVAADETRIPSNELTDFLRQKLPDFMVPSAFLFLEQLPRLPNGKLNYDKLPSVETSSNRPAFVAPRTHVEQVLADAWCQVLNLKTVGIYDNIFELGGDSILILQIVAKLNQARIHLTVNQFFKHQTIAQLAEANVATELKPVEQTLVSGDVELTPIQRWFFEQDLVDVHYYNQSIMLQAREALDARVLSETFRYLVAHHDGLRLRFRQTDAKWEQFNAESSTHEVFTHTELTGMDESEVRQMVEKEASELQAGLSLSDGSLIKARLFSFRGQIPDCLLIVIHHLAVDGVSWRILLEDLHTVYGQLLRHEAVVLPHKTTSWKTWAEQLTNLASSPELDPDAAYWVAASLRKPVKLPVDFEDGENSEDSTDSVLLTLTAEETKELLERTPKILRSSMNEVILAGLSAAVPAWVNEGAVLVDVEGHGREDLFDDVDVSRTTGWFTSLYPLFLDCAQAGNPLDALEAVKNTLQEIPTRGLSYGLLRYSSAKPEVVETLRAMPQAAISFNYLGQFDQVLNESVLFDTVLDLAGSEHSPRQRRKYVLEVISFIASRQLHLSIRFSRLLHRRSTVESLARAIVDFLRTLLILSREPQPAALSPRDFPLAQKALAKLDRQAFADLLSKEGPVENIYPLTPMQQGMLYHSLSAPDSGVYVNQMSCELRGDLNVAAFRRAWTEVLRRHSMFRTSFTWGTLVEPLAIVHEQASLEFEEDDWRLFTETEQNARLIAYMQKDCLRGFDLTKPPLTRMALLRTADDAHRFLWSFHHLLLDGWSVYLVIKEVFKVYEDACQGSLTRLEPAIPYSRYIAWLAKQDMAKAEAFWRRTLRDVTSPQRLPVRNLAATVKAEHGGFGLLRLKFSAERTAALQRLVREHRLTLNTVIQGTWALLESRYTNREDVIFGAVVSGRPPSLDGIDQMVGLFINTLPVRVRISGDTLLVDWLHELQSQQVEASEYEYSPLVQIQAWSDVPGGVPLFNSILAFENYPIDDSLSKSSERLNIRKVRSVEQTNYPITVLTGPGEELSISIVFEESKFDRPTIERMMDNFSMLLESIAGNLHQPLSRLPSLSGREQRRLYEWNYTDARLPTAQTIHRLFEEQAERTPENLAVCSATVRLSYRQLNEGANRLAHYLRRVGVRRGSLVGVCLARSEEMLVAVLAVLKAGAAYVPLDPSYPQERLRLMVEDSGMRVMVVQEEEDWAQGAGSLERVVDVTREREQIGKEESREPEVEVTGEDAAYVIYTSGSTGKPKGVVGLHSGAVNRFSWMWKAYPFEGGEICCQKTALSFLDSLWEMFGPLLQGVPIVIIPDEVVKDPVRLVATLAESQVTRIVLVPSLLRVILEAFTDLGNRLPRLKYWVSSGEALPLDLQHRFHEVMPTARLLNLYGSSEVSADVTYYETSALDPAAEGGLIGRPIANTQIYILNREIKPVPIGVPGDLYVGGLNLARGYLHKPDLTAEKFVPDPYSGEVGARLYHTGDIARYLPEGIIEYLGRSDHQVKIRGFRVELGDVEAALREHGAIRQALVEAREDEQGNRRLVAYYVCSNGQAPQGGELRSFLRLKLQEFMIPSAFVRLEELPLTPNGKVDRLALPVPDKSYPNKDTPFNAPRTQAEKSISEIWQDVLGLDRVSVDDNFFDLGGQSLLLIRVQSLLKERLNVDRPVAELFKYPSISALAASIAGPGEAPQRSHLQSLERGKRRKAHRGFASRSKKYAS